MINDERDILELLLLELDSFRKRGSALLLDTPWLLKSLFQDSLIHLDHGNVRQMRPCGECQPFNLVSASHSLEDVPCHHNFLDEVGVSFARQDDGYVPPAFEHVVLNWLRARITKIKDTLH